MNSNIINLSLNKLSIRIVSLKYYVTGICLLIIFGLIRTTKMGISEIFSSSITKIKPKIDKLEKLGFNSNITYLYYSSSSLNKDNINSKSELNDNDEIEMKEFVDLTQCSFSNYYLDKSDNVLEDVFISDLEHEYDEDDILEELKNDDYSRTTRIFIDTLEYINCLNNVEHKLSLKLSQIGNTYGQSFKNLIKIIENAKNKNIFVWIAAHKREHINDEIKTYINILDKGYINVGITLACYHNSISNTVDNILEKGGTIRLVKGYYNDGEIRKNIEINKNYMDNAKKLIETCKYHQLATHDFQNIILPLHIEYGKKNLKNIEFGFFYNSLKFILKQMKKYKIDLPKKCCLVAYGNKFKYIKSNYKDISYEKALKLNTLL